MKSNIKLSIFGFLLLLISCKDALEFDPVNNLTLDESYSSYEKIRANMTAGYFVMGNYPYYGWIFSVLPELEGNLCYINGAHNTGFNEYYQYSWNFGDEELYQFLVDAYWLIDVANNVILHIDQAEGDRAEKDQVKGEALTMRALCYFDLVRFFGRPYTYGDPSSNPGVPVVLEPGNLEPARNTVAEVYEQIFADLKVAEPLMVNENRGRFTADAAKALLARVYLYKGEWALAEDAATGLIDNSELTLSGNFFEIFDAPTASEEIFTLEMRGPDCPYNPTCWDDCRVTTDLIEAYDSNDVRREITAVQYPPDNPESPFYQAKFNISNRIPILRLGETYLIRAEARFRQNNLDGALADLNTLRLKRGATEWIDLPNGIRDILDERHRELAFEGHTSFDYWRTGTDMVRQQCNTGVEREAPCMIEADSYRTVHPIPKSEMDINPNMVQNEGY